MLPVKSSIALGVIVFILTVPALPLHSGVALNKSAGIADSAISPINLPVLPESGTGTSETAYYLSSNVTVPANSTFTLKNDRIYADSISLSAISIDVFGIFELQNSSMELLNATYNSIKRMEINLMPGSSLLIMNSDLEFPGMLNANMSNICILNSTLDSPYVNSSDPLAAEYLGENFSDSTIRIINSSVSGVLHQKNSYEFPGARIFDSLAYYQLFSRNGTVPMKVPVSPYSGDVLMNGLILNVSYTGSVNESSDYLLLELNGNIIQRYDLFYNTENNSILSAAISGSPFVHTSSWFGNTSNFSLVLVESSPYPVGISNVTVTLESNDTVHAIGYDAYDIMMDSSTAYIVNSSIALNFRSNTTGNGIPDFLANHIRASNSTIVWTDSSISGNGSYHSSPFQLINSAVYMYRYVCILPWYQGAMVSNFRFNLSPVDSLPFSVAQRPEMNLSQYSIFSNHGFIAMSGIQMNSTYLYGGEYRIDWGSNASAVSLAPFPDLPRRASSINLTLPVPAITLRVAGAAMNGENLTVNLTYAITVPQGQSFNGTIDIFTVSEEGIRNEVSEIPISGEASRNISINYKVGNDSHLSRIDAALLSSQMYVTTGRSVESCPVNHEGNADDSITISVTVSGYASGTLWFVDLDGRYLISSASSLEFNTSANLTPIIIPPDGYRISGELVTYSGNNSEIVDVSFSEIAETATFVEDGMQPGQQWSILIAGRNYSASDSTLNVSLAPGIYNYQVTAPQGMEIKKSSGIVNLTDSNATVRLIFSRSFSLIAFLDQNARHVVFYIFIAVAAGIAVAGISMRRRSSWYICISCGASVEKGRKYCERCHRQ